MKINFECVIQQLNDFDTHPISQVVNLFHTEATLFGQNLVNSMAALASLVSNPDSKVHGTNMGPIWGWQDSGGPYVGPMNFVIS